MLGLALVLVAPACRTAVVLRALVEPVASPSGAAGEDPAKLPAREGTSERNAPERLELEVLSPECDVEADVTDPGYTPEKCPQETAQSTKRWTRPERNPSMRASHGCYGPRYQTWLQENHAKLAGYRQDAQRLRLTRGSALLFLGSSHTGEVYESLLDQLSARIAKWEVMRFNASLAGLGYPTIGNMTSFPLVPMRYGVDITDSKLSAENVSYRPEYSKATLTDGTVIASFVNSGLLYEGPEGWRRILAYLGLAPRALDGVFLGKLNSIEWARKRVFLPGEGAQAFEFEPREVIEFLTSQGYAGRTLLWDKFGTPVSQRQPAMRANATNANAVDLDDFSSAFSAPCIVRQCALAANNSHLCNPGPPAAFSAAIPKLLGKY